MKLLKNASRVAILCFFLLCVNGCKEEKDDSPLPYNPNLPVTISDFTPHNGGAKTRMIIYGSNFGTDPSIISLKIGGKEAKVINSRGDCLYCITPSMCYEGTVELKVGESEPVIAPEKFQYNKTRTVSTLCGYVDELNNGEIATEGSFDELEKIQCPAWLSFDPKDPDILYCTQENDADGATRRLLKFDLKNRYMSTCIASPINGVHRLKSISWSLSGDSMIIATTKGGDNPSNQLLLRSEGFSKAYTVTKSMSCPSSVIHPETGDLFFGRFDNGTLNYYNFREHGLNQNQFIEELFKIQDNSWSFHMNIHPSGDYMYILVVNKHYILRSNFDRKTKRFTVPYIVAGKVGSAGYQDLVGTNARFNCPTQGVFVKNPEYIGQSDEYDFYFVDRENHCIRVLTPQGVVSTFAGRGTSGISGASGYIDGDLRKEARFKSPRGIAYDEKNDVFYVADTGNFRIRKISYEFTDDVNESNDSEDGAGEESTDVENDSEQNDNN